MTIENDGSDSEEWNENEQNQNERNQNDNVNDTTEENGRNLIDLQSE